MKFLEAKRLNTERQENKALGGPAENKSAGRPTGDVADGLNVSQQGRVLAKELGVDLAGIQGTGTGGQVTARDVREAHEARSRAD